MNLTSTAFEDQQAIPRQHSCDGADTAPPLDWSDVPSAATSLALLCWDPDAPGGTFWHWTVWDLDPGLSTLREGEVPENAREGQNGFGTVGYRGPCPPPGHGVHHYHFELFALSTSLELAAGAAPATVRAQCEQHEVGRAELVGTYERA
jgi:Raf kinase inhibitor-like YbhB/YbcL family protein